MQAGDYAKAIADWDVEIKLEPHDPELFRGLEALCWSMLAEPDEAIADYSPAISLDPGLVDSYLKRAEAWSREELSTTRRSPTIPMRSSSIPNAPRRF